MYLELPFEEADALVARVRSLRAHQLQALRLRLLQCGGPQRRCVLCYSRLNLCVVARDLSSEQRVVSAVEFFVFDTVLVRIVGQAMESGHRACGTAYSSALA